jgi:hypothetical protein
MPQTEDVSRLAGSRIRVDESVRAVRGERETDLGFLRVRITALTSRVRTLGDSAGGIIARLHDEGDSLRGMAAAEKKPNSAGALPQVHRELDELDMELLTLQGKLERLESLA